MGFTVMLPNLEKVTEGIIVAHAETQNCFDDEGLEKVVQHAEKHDHPAAGLFIAAWLINNWLTEVVI